MALRAQWIEPTGPEMLSGWWEQEPLRRVVDSALEAFVSVDEDGRVVWWNRMAEETFGWSSQEAIGELLGDLIVPARYRGNYERALDGLRAFGPGATGGRRLEREAVHRDGHEFAVEFTIAPMRVGELTTFNVFLRDISERREGEAAMALLAEVVRSSDDAIVARDLDGTVRSWNAGAERVLGYTAEEMVGKSIAPVWRADRERFEAMQARLAAGERVPTFDARAVRGDGALIDVSVTASPLIKDGEVAGVAVIFRDVTQRRRAEEGVRLLAALVEGSEDAIVVGGLDGAITMWNPGAERLYGYTAEEMLGESIAIVRPEGNLDQVADARAALAAGQSVPTYETREVRKDGSPVDVSVSLSPVKDAAGQVVGVSSIVRDISARKDAERERDQAAQRFANAFEGAPIGMALVAVDGRWLAVNQSLCRLLGRTPGQLLKTTSQAVTHPDDLYGDLDQVARTLAGEIDGYQMDKRYVRPDGAAVWATLCVSLVKDDQGRPLHFIAQVQDISEQKQAEAELSAYSRHLSELALQDPVSGLPGYRDFHTALDHELERARRHGGTWSVVLFDVDGFTSVNDRQGRLAGDQVLRAVGAALQQARRASDHAARIGTDEFAFILPQTVGQDAARTAQRIAAEVAARAGVSLSYGIGAWPRDGKSKQRVLQQADLELQRARGIQARTAADSAGESESLPPGLERLLSLARKQLDMDLAYIALVADDQQTFVSIEGDASSFGVAPGDQMPLAESYCARMLDGRIENAVPDTGADAELAALDITPAAGVGAYLGVPLKLPDGELYGTLCCVAHARKPGLAANQVQLMHFLADLVADQIHRHKQDTSDRRTESELAGIKALLSALEARDHYTGEHSKIVVRHASEVARRLGLGPEATVEVEQVALLHDIGKVGVPDAILQKRGPLNEQEWELMRQHPAIGARILAGTETLSHLAAAIKAEHERFDGNGYPDGLAGQDIPLASRIAFACDAYHAMTSNRPYRAALPPEQARSELEAQAGSQFDPAVIKALLSVLAAEPPPAARPG